VFFWLNQTPWFADQSLQAIANTPHINNCCLPLILLAYAVGKRDCCHQAECMIHWNESRNVTARPEGSLSWRQGVIVIHLVALFEE
jgi:hypothetical protein